jgi:hypothetical protein
VDQKKKTVNIHLPCVSIKISHGLAYPKIEELREIYNLIPIFLIKLVWLYTNVISINMGENYKNGDTESSTLSPQLSFWL